MNHHSYHWRLLISEPAKGDWNMAADEAILEAAAKRAVPPTLRLFAWDPPCLSLGYAQHFSDVDAHRLEELGWAIVRRPTGGRAILHTDELTYSVIGPMDEPHLSGTVLESYQRLSTALLLALEYLGVPAQSVEHPESQAGREPKAPICFEVPSNYEITVGGRKIIGSAQARKKGGFLQHGSLPLSGDLARITQVLVFASEADRLAAVTRVHERAATVEEILQRAPAWKDAADAFQRAFQASLGIELIRSPLTAWEEKRIEELIQEKYGNPEWTRKLVTVR